MNIINQRDGGNVTTGVNSPIVMRDSKNNMQNKNNSAFGQKTVLILTSVIFPILVGIFLYYFEEGLFDKVFKKAIAFFQ